MLAGGRHQRGGNRRGDHDRGNHRSGCWCWDWRRFWSRCSGKFWARRRNLFQVIEDAFRQVKLGGKRLLFGQGAGHAQMFFGFLLGLAATGQQQQQQQHHHCPAARQAQ
ncbi:hypothetical protein D9M71_823480 [compost metagenome]